MFDYCINSLIKQPLYEQRPFLKRDEQYVKYIKFHSCPYLTINSSWSDYKKTKRRKFWYNIRRSERLIKEEVGELEFKIASTPVEISNILPEIFDLHEKRWSDQFTTSDFSTLDGRKKYNAAAMELSEIGECEIAYLMIDGKVLSYSYSLIQDNNYYFYSHASSLSRGLRKYSLGKVLISKLLETVFDRKFNCFDFMIGEESYKYEWTKTSTPSYRVVTVPKIFYYLPILYIKWMFYLLIIKVQKNENVKQKIKKIILLLKN